MDIINPLPSACVLLLPFLYGGYLLGFRFTENIISDRISQRLVSIGSFISIWLLVLIYAGLISGSFLTGLTIGTICPGIFGFYYEYFIYRKNIKNKIRDRIEFKLTNKWMLFSALLGSALIYYIGSHGSFHDEKVVNSHLAMIAQFQNGYFPLRNLINPTDALPYHYGFDIICASLTAFTRCSVDFAIDLVTAASWFFCWVVLWKLGEKLFPFKYAGVSVAVCTLFGGGLATFFGFFLPHIPMDLRISGNYGLHTEISMNPPLISYIFQHPFAAGLPLVCCILLLISESTINKSLQYNLVIASLLIALYFCQTVLFITLTPVLAFYYIIYKKQYWFIVTSVFIFGLIIISRSGLLFTQLQIKPDSGIVFRFWPTELTFFYFIIWHIGTYGLLPVFGSIGILRLSRLKPVFICVLFTILVPVFVNYKYTWDIVKFSTVASFYLGILSGGGISWMIGQPSVFIRRVAFISMIFLTGTSIANAGVLIYEESYSNNVYYKQYDEILPSDYTASLNWLRTQVKSDEMVLCNKNYYLPIALYGGLPVVYDEILSYTKSFGVPEERCKRFSEMVQTNNYTLEDFQKYGIFWVIQDDGDSMNLSKLLSLKSFTEVKRFGKLRVFRFND